MPWFKRKSLIGRKGVLWDWTQWHVPDDLQHADVEVMCLAETGDLVKVEVTGVFGIGGPEKTERLKLYVDGSWVRRKHFIPITSPQN